MIVCSPPFPGDELWLYFFSDCRLWLLDAPLLFYAVALVFQIGYRPCFGVLIDSVYALIYYIPWWLNVLVLTCLALCRRRFIPLFIIFFLGDFMRNPFLAWWPTCSSSLASCACSIAQTIKHHLLLGSCQEKRNWYNYVTPEGQKKSAIENLESRREQPMKVLVPTTRLKKNGMINWIDVTAKMKQKNFTDVQDQWRNGLQLLKPIAKKKGQDRLIKKCIINEDER